MGNNNLKLTQWARGAIIVVTVYLVMLSSNVLGQSSQ